MTIFFLICIFLLPWVIIPSCNLADPFRIPKATFFDLICLGMICFSFYTGLRKRYFNKYLSWFLIWLFIVIGLNWYLPFTLSFNNRQTVNLWILEPMLHLILAIFLSYIALSYFDKDDYIKIAKTLCLSSVLISSIGILQVIGLDIFGMIAKYNLGNRFCAFLDNPNLASNYIMLSLPLFLLFKQKKYLFGMFIVIAGIIISKSIFSMICGGIGLLVYLFLIIKERKIAFYSLLSLLVISIINLIFNFKFIDRFSSHRFEIWKIAFKNFQHNPIFGQGIGIVRTWELQIPGLVTKWLTLHNDWFEIAIGIGVVGIVLMLLVIVNSIRKFNYKDDNRVGYVFFASFISFLVLMFGSFPLEIAPLALFGLINWWAVETM